MTLAENSGKKISHILTFNRQWFRKSKGCFIAKVYPDFSGDTPHPKLCKRFEEDI